MKRMYTRKIGLTREPGEPETKTTREPDLGVEEDPHRSYQYQLVCQ